MVWHTPEPSGGGYFPPEGTAVEFKWDPGKAEKNQRKHRVGFAEASSVFGDPLELTIPDPDHSREEQRFLSIGRSVLGNTLVVSYTEREHDRIRIISARKATKSERQNYEQVGH